MRAPFVFCVATIFYTILVASRAGENYGIQNSTTTLDVECKEADCIKLLLDHIMMKSDEENYHKRRKKVYISRIKRRTTRLRMRTNAKSRNSTKGDKEAGRPADHGPPDARDSNKTDLYKNESVDGSLWNRTDVGDAQDLYESFSNYPFQGGLQSLLVRLAKTLENNCKEDDCNTSNSSAIDDAGNFGDEDRCQKWLDNWEKIEKAFPGSVTNLPACPCLYPNGIFYDNQIWDKKRQKKFRWRDVSHDKDRIAIYKSGAVYCVQTLPSQGNESAIVQHCCYSKNRKLLTRGSGAGTPYIVSPDISPLLHDRIDLLPWRLCKGDFTRYNEVRIPNNDNNCEINPDNKEYQHQVKRAKNYR